jgi:hypothetical protein
MSFFPSTYLVENGFCTVQKPLTESKNRLEICKKEVSSTNVPFNCKSTVKKNINVCTYELKFIIRICYIQNQDIHLNTSAMTFVKY